MMGAEQPRRYGHGIDFRALKTEPIERVLSHRGMLEAYRIRGDRLVGPCPVHGGDNPSAFVVTRSKNLWFCFSRCQRGGDVIDLVARLDRTSRVDAARYLIGLPATRDGSLTAAPNDTVLRRSDSPFQPFTRRLILDPFAPFIQRKAIAPATARLFEAGQWHGSGWLAGCVAVRLHDVRGNPLGYAGRRLNNTLSSHTSKWRMPARLPKNTMLYGWHRIQRNNPALLVVVECPWAVMRLHQLGIPAVALLGLELSDTQRELIQTVQRAIILFDGDDAGRIATPRIANLLRRTNGTNVQTISLPVGYDPDELSDRQLTDRIKPFLS